MNFSDGYNLKIGNNVEKKGKFKYLSWVFAVKELRENYPDATWLIHETDAGMPCFGVPGGYMVKVSVILDGKYFTQFHPILDNRNKSLESPNPFQINTSIQRCLTKAIGLATGIGLPLYAGEDLPMEEKVEEKALAEKKNIPTINEEAWEDKLNNFADPDDPRPAQERLELITNAWKEHVEPKLNDFTKKGRTSITNTYNGSVEAIENQIKDLENG